MAKMPRIVPTNINNVLIGTIMKRVLTYNTPASQQDGINYISHFNSFTYSIHILQLQIYYKYITNITYITNILQQKIRNATTLAEKLN